ncbi:hypothetical protein SMI01S_28850 [Sphingobacterium mizutaii NBRC 14946 = DSM 11724]|uniref:Uncharacterized protein n=3 Tax=Sphingobacteriaceae TaxID=84566 RepID=A0AAJ5BZE1_9SPHI|nr:hypothetical protein SMI01S_28850 [Sphingobacterium mizutaii NBRC 14946 = DSM 11724]SDL42749.1 hypothetical protein SAMN05192578_103331 [Sphingobacterium mizutaii]SNV45227.1 Uncharacterised protein [Sphingobacterium mizutaii]
MLDFLKDITFKANDVVLRAIDILMRNYISIAGLCFLIFVTSNLSSFLAMYLDSSNLIVKVLLLLLFVAVYFGLQLVLLKKAIFLAKDEKSHGLMDYLPSMSQFCYYILGLLLYSLIAFVIYIIMYVALFPLLYLGVNMNTVQTEIHPFLTGVIMLFVLIRTTFFPFFIVENGFNTFKSYRFSLAMTKGNVLRLLAIIFIVAFTHLLQLGTEYMGYSLVSKILSLINSFVIIPVVSVVMSIVYIDMIKAYKGSSDPSLMDNII